MILGSPLEEASSSPADFSAPLMRFGFPIARNDSSPLIPGLPHPIRSTFRFSQPLSGLLLKPSCGLISYHWHSWDLLFRVFPSKTASHPRQVWLPLKFSASCHHLHLAGKWAHMASWMLQTKVCATQRYSFDRCWSVPKSVHIQRQFYPSLKADTLLSLRCLLGGITDMSRCCHHPLMQLEGCRKRRFSLLQSIKNTPTRIPKGIHRLVGFVPFFASQGLRPLHDRAYKFTLSKTNQKAVTPSGWNERLDHAPVKPEHFATHCQGPAFQRYPSRPNGHQVGALQQCCLSRVLRTEPAPTNLTIQGAYSWY